jgi:hypothetical protein
MDAPLIACVGADDFPAGAIDGELRLQRMPLFLA